MDTTSAEFLNQVDSASAFFKEQRRVSVAEFQRKYQIGFARAVAICDELVNRGELIHLKMVFISICLPVISIVLSWPKMAQWVVMNRLWLR